MVLHTPVSATAWAVALSLVSAGPASTDVELCSADVAYNMEGEALAQMKAVGLPGGAGVTHSDSQEGVLEQNPGSTIMHVRQVSGNDSKPQVFQVDPPGTIDGVQTNQSQANSIQNSRTAAPYTAAPCVTQDDPSVRVGFFTGFFYSVAPPGTPCAFGADVRDDGWHCIWDDGKYGEYGWCFTSQDRSVFGPCAIDCPSYGPWKAVEQRLRHERELGSGHRSALLEQQVKATAQQTPTEGEVVECRTQVDPMATVGLFSGLLYSVAPPGTPCTFGVDRRDEGRHCIWDDGKYGEFGWCYTSTTRTAFGACSGTCPLFGLWKVVHEDIIKMASSSEGLDNQLTNSAGGQIDSLTPAALPYPADTR